MSATPTRMSAEDFVVGWRLAALRERDARIAELEAALREARQYVDHLHEEHGATELTNMLGRIDSLLTKEGVKTDG